jgi:hypothetical protein
MCLCLQHEQTHRTTFVITAGPWLVPSINNTVLTLPYKLLMHTLLCAVTGVASVQTAD